MGPKGLWHLAALGLLPAGASAPAPRPRPPSRLRLATFMNKANLEFAYLQVSAEAHGLHPEVLGFGLEAWWPEGLGVKINALRRFVMESLADEDVLVFADAFDVLVLANEDEILAKFTDIEAASNRSVVLNAEDNCFPVAKECGQYPKQPFRWRYLNSGLIVGRGAALKVMLRDPVPDIMEGSDQYWYHQYYGQHPDRIFLDTTCTLLCAVQGLDAASDGAHLKDGRVIIPATGSRPALVHLPGPGHWPWWHHFRATSWIGEAFRELYPQADAHLFDRWWFGANLGSYPELVAYRGPALWWVMRGFVCFSCNVLGSDAGECRDFRGFFCTNCATFSAIMVPVILISSLLAWRCIGRRCSVPLLFSVPEQVKANLRRAVVRFRSQLGPPSTKIEPAV